MIKCSHLGISMACRAVARNLIEPFIKCLMSRTINNPDFILNWPPLKKCMLVLTLATLTHSSWLLWKIFLLLHPNTWKFFNVDLVKEFLPYNIATIAVLILLTLVCWISQRSKFAQLFLSYVSAISFGLSMCLDAYVGGVMSPATSLMMVLAVTIGLLLFERELVYTSALICFSVLGWILYQTIKGQLVYAPLFITLEMVDPTSATIFWTFSMLWFMFPVLFGGMILLEVLLSQWRKREKNVEWLSKTDPLTGLYNRRTIHDHLMALASTRRTKQQLHAVILLDLDHFKQINDKYGHAVGDDVLKLAAATLQDNIRQEDMVGRFGGEEFIVILNDTSLEQTQNIAERCRTELMKSKLSTSPGLTITASFGIACFSSGESNIDQILKQADDALYEAKNQGRNRVVVDQSSIPVEPQES